MHITAFQRTVGLSLVAAAALSTSSVGAPAVHARSAHLPACLCSARPKRVEQSLHRGRATVPHLIVAHFIADCSYNRSKHPGQQDERKSPVAHKLAESMIEWIGAKTGWAARAVPRIRFSPMAELSKAYSCGKTDKLDVEAIYSDTEHVIYLPDNWNPNNLRNRSALLHELVHHLQYLNKIKVTCEAEYEWKAYKLQVEWLREQGVEKPFELLGITPFEVYVLSHCPEF